MTGPSSVTGIIMDALAGGGLSGGIPPLGFPADSYAAVRTAKGQATPRKTERKEGVFPIGRDR